MLTKKLNTLTKRLDYKNLSRKKKRKYLHIINILERKEYNKEKEIFYMKNFYLEDGCFYCNKDDGNTLHETHIEIKALVGYDVGFGRIQKPDIISKPMDNYIGLVCSCGNFEIISDEFLIKDDYIVKKNKEEIILPEQWIAKVGNKYVRYDFGDTVKLIDSINEATVMNTVNKNIIHANAPFYAEHEPEYENIEWIKVEVKI